MYIELCKHKSVNVAELSRLTGIHRPQLYALLADLVNKELVQTVTVGKRQEYASTGPERLESAIQQTIEHVRQEGALLISQTAPQDGVSLIKNKGDIIAMYENLVDELEPHSSYYSLTTVVDYPIDEYLPRDFRKIREAKSLTSYVISPVDLKRPIRFSLNIRHVAWNHLRKNCSWNCFGTKFAFIDFETETGYIISNAALAEFQQGIVKKLFDVATQELHP